MFNLWVQGPTASARAKLDPLTPGDDWEEIDKDGNVIEAPKKPPPRRLGLRSAIQGAGLIKGEKIKEVNKGFWIKDSHDDQKGPWG